MNIILKNRSKRLCMPWTCLVVGLLMLWGCDDGGGSGRTSTIDSGEILFYLQLENEKSVSTLSRKEDEEFDCRGNHIRTIEIEVQDEWGDVIAEGGPWDCEDQKGYVPGVLAGPDRRVIARARDDVDQVIFKGEKEGITVFAGQKTDAGVIWLYKVLNRAPAFDPVPDRVIEGGMQLAIQISASDPDLGDRLTYDAENLPEGATFDSATREFIWIPGEDAQGIFNILFTVSDNDALNPLSDYLEVKIQVVVGPYVVSTDPPALADGVCPTRQVEAVFSEPMDSDTIYGVYNAFTLARIQENERIPVSGDILYKNRKLTFSTTYELMLATQYEATISGSVLSTSREPLSDGYGYSWSFTTAGVPTVVSMTPEPGAECVDLMPKISVSFSQPMNPSDINESVFDVYSIDSNIVEGEVDYEGQKATFSPWQELSPSTTYEVKISSEPSDLCGTPLNGGKDDLWFFTTTSMTPGVVEHIPKDGIWTNPIKLVQMEEWAPLPIIVTFSHQMDMGSFGPNAFTVKTGNGEPVSGTVTFMKEGGHVVFTPDDLWDETQITASISGDVADLCGKRLSNGDGYEWSFTPIYDTTPPEITILSDNPERWPVGTAYHDAGATATDNVDGEVQVQTDLSQVNTIKVGTFNIAYTAMDSAGNKATATRTVIVQDMTPPEITVFGDNPASLEVHADYEDAGAMATDNLDVNVRVQTDLSQVDTSKLGNFKVTYMATDSAGNKATANRTVIVEDTTAPEIKVLPPNPASVERGKPYEDAGATATDNYDLKVQVLTDLSHVDTSKSGDFEVIYTATDSSGNNARATRTVRVYFIEIPGIITW